MTDDALELRLLEHSFQSDRGLAALLGVDFGVLWELSPWEAWEWAFMDACAA
jgi:hypothetical protein